MRLKVTEISIVQSCFPDMHLHAILDKSLA
jgi:hypothetical protein